MITRSQKIRLGIFISSALSIFIATIFVISISGFFKEKDVYYIAYQNISVSGLDVGSSVKYLGIKVGAIKDIRVDPEDINRIIVTVGINKGTPIKKDVKAEISTIGITGIKLIELRGGTNEAPFLELGGFIKAGSSLTEDITGKAELIAEKIELLLNNLLEFTSDPNRGKILDLVDHSTNTFANFNSILNENKKNIRRSIANLDDIMNELALAGRSTRTAMQKIESFVKSDTVTATLKNIAEISDKLNKSNIYNLDEQVNIAIDRTNKILNQLDLLVKNNRVQFNETINDLNETIQYLNNAARQIDEDPSVLLGGTTPKNPPDDKLEP